MLNYAVLDSYSAKFTKCHRDLSWDFANSHQVLLILLFSLDIVRTQPQIFANIAENKSYHPANSAILVVSILSYFYFINYRHILSSDKIPTGYENPSIITHILHSAICGGVRD